MLKLKPNNDIELTGFVLQENKLLPVGAPSFKQWEKAGEFIKRSHEAVKFWRGDWLNYGENNYDQWSQHFDEEELASETLRLEKWVAKRVPSVRRRTNLSWSHHYEVASLEPEDQDKMLDLAGEERLSSKKFRRVVLQYKMKLDLLELSDEQLKPTDPEVFARVQVFIDESCKALETLESLKWGTVHKDAQDFLLSHLKRATGYYLSILQKYDKQKSVSKGVVQKT